MTKLREGLLPFEDLDDQQFEAFLLLFLGAGISLEVIELASPAKNEPVRPVRYRVLRASKYGDSGPAGQRGIDIRAVTETGAEWVFQCKHYRSAFTPSKAKAAVSKAEKEYPGAARYFLVLSGEPSPKIRDVVDERPQWEVWGGSEVSVRFFNELTPSSQIEILRRVFPQRADALIARLYPQHDDPLVDVDAFFALSLRDERLLHHRAKLVGREQPLRALHDFVENGESQACVLSAPGGIGKTRLLRAFGNTFSDEHKDRQLYFLDSAARPGVGSDRLRAARDEELVVVVDDAHRSETLRADILRSVIEKNGKLVLATRPHAVEELVAWLIRNGLDHAAIQELPPLPRLSPEKMLELARECLPARHKDLALPLSQLAEGCALFVTIGGKLIADGKIAPAELLQSKDFHRVVFERFESEGFGRVAGEASAPLLKEILRLLAILAPWSDRNTPLDAITRFLGCTPREFQENFDRLRAAGLLLETREGWRVVPDLFADHLVYRGCYDDDGRLTVFAQRFQSGFDAVAATTALRNLAEAEWRAQIMGKHIESLIAPFWRHIRERFATGHFMERERIVKDWKRIAVFQPERTLELVRLAIDLEEAPPLPKDLQRKTVYRSIFCHSELLKKLPPLLEPIAVYHRENRTVAMDLLWELHQRRDRMDESPNGDPFGIKANSQDNPLATIGRVAGLRYRHSLEAPLAVVRWLREKLCGTEATSVCDRPSPALAVMLKGIFERKVENAYSTGNLFHVETWPVSVEKTRGVRQETLELLRDVVIPHGETATLNALTVLDSATSVVRRYWKDPDDTKLQQSWRPERMEALKTLEQLLSPDQSPRVLFRIYRMLRRHSGHDPDSKFRDECARVIGNIPNTAAFRMARVLLSNGWEEFYFNDPKKRKPAREASPEVEAQWEKLTLQVANEFLEDHRSAHEVVSAAERLSAEYKRAGLKPEFSSVFQAIAKISPDIADGCIELLLAKADSPLDSTWTQWFIGRRRLPDAQVQDWIRKVLRGDNRIRWRSLQSTLRWAGIGEVTDDVISEVGSWAQRLNDETIDEALSNLWWRDDREKPFDETILCNLNLSGLSDKSIEKLCNSLETVESTPLPLPNEFAENLIHELRRVGNLSHFEPVPFLQHLANQKPLEFYRMLKERVLDSRTGRQSEQEKGFVPMPAGFRFPLSGLPEVPGYKEIAADLFTCLRASNTETEPDWRHLFQNAVLSVSPIGLEYIRQWLTDVENADELERLIDTLEFEGSMIIFEEPDIPREILNTVRKLTSPKYGELRIRLGRTAAPKIRGYTGHVLDPEYRYYREAAAKAASIHASDPELSAFYQEIVHMEDADAARERRQADLEHTEWD